ncbi:uncharacterized protein [Taeniopygia guttata]|uniref:uncharacterized protein isoform X2 n=1 Tax=Taeniopygia guttata TaxID=59729 RepID=UPI001BC8C8DE|nr:uncharacterized protein LOC116807730 isoform X2 [Taeniopygia guttata]XP_041569401.1 uncharacterized protein LOC116807730 isoform X2 [Taeniopygia guttata]XP_041569402.1 uncharacterized protein LOC116807730 isoform X2 [Taeniopygia guttata]XP_041569403.1 uncharacterized protein LOC116807730 isoform X2 [Taeniopygia guttata]
MVRLGKQQPPLPRLSPARAVCSPLIARRGHPAPAAPPSRDGYIQRLLSRNFPGTASCDRTRSGASAAIAASRGRRTEPPPLSRRGSGRRTLPRGPPASFSSARGAAGDAQAKNPFHEQGRRQQCFYSPEKCLLLEMIFTLFLKSMPSLLVSWCLLVMLQIEAGLAGGSMSFTVEHVTAGTCSSLKFVKWCEPDRSL